MKYWTYMKGEVPGCFEPAELAALPGFTMTTLVCPSSGEIAEKNWRRAGEFEDVARAVEAREASIPPLSPAQPPAITDVDALLDNASTRLFSHVADLMKELETRRGEKSLIVSLQRQITALKEQLAESREKVTLLELRVPRIAELEEERRKDRQALESLQASLARSEALASELRAAYEKARGELETARQRLQEINNDLGIRNRLVDKLSRDLSEKELSLAKSLGVIRRLEEDLNRLCPPPERPKPEPIAASEPAPPSAPLSPLDPGPEAQPNKVLSVPELKTPPGAFTNDEPPPPPPYLEPPVTDAPKAQVALMGFLRKVFPGQSH